MTDDLLARAQALVGHTFAKPALLAEALTHTSAADTRLGSNERMEFLGDAVLDLVVCHLLYARFPEHSEGELTKVKSAVVSRRTCALIARETGLDTMLVVGRGIEGRRHIPASLSAAVYESVVAALYLDGGFPVAERYVRQTIASHVERMAESLHAQNYKATLQQHAQKELGMSPVYVLLDEKGPDHDKCFEVGVSLEGRGFPGAWGPNKKTAEQKAALLALTELRLITPEECDLAMLALEDLPVQLLDDPAA